MAVNIYTIYFKIESCIFSTTRRIILRMNKDYFHKQKLVFLKETQCVFCEVKTAFLNII
jgi:hypothetical protein